MSYNTEFDTIIHQLLSAAGQEEARRLLREFPWLTSKKVYHELTRRIAEKRRKRDPLGMMCLMAGRGFLQRCQVSESLDKALADQPGWPLYNQGPLNQLLGLSENALADERIHWANLASQDVDSEEEPDFRGLVDFHLGWGFQDKAEEGSEEARDRAIAHFEKAEKAWQWEDSLFGGRLLRLAQEYLGRLYLERRHRDRVQDVEAALSWLKKAHDIFEKDTSEKDTSPKKQLALSMLLGKTYLNQVKGERLQNFEESIHYYRQAHALAEQLEKEKLLGDIEYSLGDIEYSLAFAYRLRMQSDPAEDNYEQAREWAERTLGRLDRRKSPEEWARTTGELATIYAHRLQGDRAANLKTAIGYAHQALEIYRPDAHPRQWTLVQLILGNMYCDQISGTRAENDQRAIRCFQNVLEHCDPESEPLRWTEAMNNLGTVYASYSTRLDDANYRAAIDCFRQTLEVRTRETMPAKTLQTATNWGNLDFGFGCWARACESFQIALKAGEVLYQASSTEAGRRAELAETWQLVARAAYCWLRMEQPDQALLQLEGGKARMLAEALALGDADLSGLPAAEQEAMLGAWQAIRKLEAEMRLPQDTPGRRGDRDLARDLGKTYTESDRLVQTIRAKHPDFMPTGLDLPGILAQIPEGGALVAPLVTAQGSATFVLPSGTQEVGVEHVIPLDAFSNRDLDDLLVGTQQAPGWLRAYATWRDGGPLRDWKRAVETLTGRLWEALVGTLHERLSGLGLVEGAPVTLMPQGGLGLLPLHAAWRGVNGAKRAFLDDYTVSYAPSAYALSVSRRRLQDERRHQPRLLAMVNPTGDLLYAPMEGRAVAEIFPSTARLTLVEGDATLEAVLREAPGRTYLHFACHGSYGWQDVMCTALVLAGRHHFTLSEILKELDLDVARLVTLSACETGLTEFQRSPDEYIGLPAGFLQVGAPEVVSSLWAVDDLSTALLMDRFYRHHLQEGLGIGQALRAAQLWLRREVDRALVVKHIQSMLSELEAQQQHVTVPAFSEAAFALGRRIHRLQQQCEALLKDEKRDPGGRPFDHPYYWAAFTAWSPNVDATEMKTL